MLIGFNNVCLLQVLLTGHPSVILNKKTLRNYTPRESQTLLRQFEEERQQSRDRREAETDSQFSSLTRKRDKAAGRREREARDSAAAAW